MVTASPARRDAAPAARLLPPAHLTGPAAGALQIREAAAVYRPRHPERTHFYRLLDQHFDRYLACHEERFEPRSGPSRSVVTRAVPAFLDCGRLKSGFARIRCPTCKGEHLLAFSCQTRNFCPSCQAKRSALFAERLQQEILAPVPHRHFVFTIPKVLRASFARDRRLLGLLSRSAFHAVKSCFQAAEERPDAVPGMVTSIQTFGSYAANFHPHIHALVSEGLFTDDGAFLPLRTLDTATLCEVFRHLVLNALHEARRLSEGFRDSLRSWVHSGFSVHAEQVTLPHEPESVERLARYLTRAPIRLDALRVLPTGQVAVRTPPDPRTGAKERVLDPLDWIHAITQQIPDRGQHLTRYYGFYSSRSRGARKPPLPPHDPGLDVAEEPETDFTRARRSSWARLLRRLFEVDPLLCPRCGVEMRIVSVITEPRTVDRILAHLGRGKGHDPFEPRAPPPELPPAG